MNGAHSFDFIRSGVIIDLTSNFNQFASTEKIAITKKAVGG